MKKETQGAKKVTEAAEKNRNLIPIDWGCDDLPTMPFVAQRLIGIIGDKDVEISELEELIGQDPALTMKILQICNSALYSLSSEVTSIRHAITLLGSENIIQIAISALLAKRFMTVPSELKGHAQALWKHLLTTAILARDFSSDIEEPDLYTLGLLHDVGWLVLMAQAPKVFTSLYQEQGRPLHELEEAWGVDHQLWGAKLLERWSLPEPFQVVALRHHDPLVDAAPTPYLLIITLSNYLASAIGNRFLETEPTEIDPRVLKALKLDEGTIQEMVDGAMEEKEKIDSLCAILGS